MEQSGATSQNEDANSFHIQNKKILSNFFRGGTPSSSFIRPSTSTSSHTQNLSHNHHNVGQSPSQARKINLKSQIQNQVYQSYFPKQKNINSQINSLKNYSTPNSQKSSGIKQHFNPPQQNFSQFQQYQQQSQFYEQNENSNREDNQVKEEMEIFSDVSNFEDNKYQIEDSDSQQFDSKKLSQIEKDLNQLKEQHYNLNKTPTQSEKSILSKIQQLESTVADLRKQNFKYPSTNSSNQGSHFQNQRGKDDVRFKSSSANVPLIGKAMNSQQNITNQHDKQQKPQDKEKLNQGMKIQQEEIKEIKQTLTQLLALQQSYINQSQEKQNASKKEAEDNNTPRQQLNTPPNLMIQPSNQIQSKQIYNQTQSQVITPGHKSSLSKIGFQTQNTQNTITTGNNMNMTNSDKKSPISQVPKLNFNLMDSSNPQQIQQQQIQMEQTSDQQNKNSLHTGVAKIQGGLTPEIMHSSNNSSIAFSQTSINQQNNQNNNIINSSYYKNSKFSEEEIQFLINLQFSQIQRGQSFSLQKKIEFDNQIYIIICGIEFQQNASQPLIFFKGFDQNMNPLKNETINQDALQYAMENIYFDDIMPTTMPFLSCQSNYMFLKYLIMPFMSIHSDGQTLKFLTQAPGIFSSSVIHTFLKTNCLIHVHHIEGLTLRIVISANNPNQHVFIDIEFDKSAYEQFFQTLLEQEHQTYEEQQLIDFFRLTDSGSELQTENKELKNRQILSREMSRFIQQQQNGQKTYEVDSLRLKDTEDFLVFLYQKLEEYQKFIREIKQIETFQQLLEYEAQNLTFSRIKVYTSLKKSTIQYATYEQNDTKIQVQHKNNYETFGIKGAKIHAFGQSELEIKQLERIYGLKMEEQSNVGQRMLLSFALDKFSLHIKEKVDGNLMRGKVSKFSENPITQVQMVHGSFDRNVFPMEDYNLILTLELVGIAGKTQGVKCLIYNPESNEETGVFLSINEQQWKFTNQEIRKKMYLKNTDILPLADNLITHLFKLVCVPLITDKLLFDNGKDSKLKGFQLNPSISLALPLARLESVFSIDTLVQYYSTSDLE